MKLIQNFLYFKINNIKISVYLKIKYKMIDIKKLKWVKFILQKFIFGFNSRIFF